MYENSLITQLFPQNPPTFGITVGTLLKIKKFSAKFALKTAEILIFLSKKIVVYRQQMDPNCRIVASIFKQQYWKV